jgi:hypothetical protein
MGRVGLIMAALAFVTVALSMLIPGLGALCVGPLTALLIGSGAGWWASKVLGSGNAGRGAGAGAIAGLGALFGAAVGLTVLASIVGTDPQFQQQLQDQFAQDPNVQLPEGFNPAALVGVGGAIGGFCIGLFYLVLAVIGGLIAGLVYGNRGATAATPMGGYPAGQATYTAPGMEPNQGLRGTPPDDPDRGARIYPDDQRRE